jgi:hypothetical protein
MTGDQAAPQSVDLSIQKVEISFNPLISLISRASGGILPLVVN